MDSKIARSKVHEGGFQGTTGFCTWEQNGPFLKSFFCPPKLSQPSPESLSTSAKDHSSTPARQNSDSLKCVAYITKIRNQSQGTQVSSTHRKCLQPRRYIPVRLLLPIFALVSVRDPMSTSQRRGLMTNEQWVIDPWFPRHTDNHESECTSTNRFTAHEKSVDSISAQIYSL